jgi:glycosyltransferase involved in cell wall biosynthesis
MRLLFVATNISVPGTNGGSTHVTEVVAGLRRHHDVLLAARYGSKGPDTLGVGLGASAALAPVHAATIYPFARRFRPEAIYERFSARGAGVLLGRALGIPVISMVLDTDVSPLTWRGAARLITTAPHLVPEAYQNKVVRVSWGANIERFRPDVPTSGLREQLGYVPSDFLLVYTGAFYHWHGLDILVRAVAELDRQARAGALKLLLVGDGQMRQEIEELTDELRIRHRVQFAGVVPYVEVPRYVAIADACTAVYDPSRNATLAQHGMFFDPLKIFEYLACGKPTLMLDTENMRAIFEQDRHAHLVKTGSVPALVDAIERLMTDGELRDRLGAEGQKLVRERYSWQAHADHLGRLFEEVVAEARGRHAEGARERALRNQ